MMAKKTLSELQKEFRTFFQGKLRLFEVKSPAELSTEKKREFFTSIKHDWERIKYSKKYPITNVIDFIKSISDIKNVQLDHTKTTIIVAEDPIQSPNEKIYPKSNHNKVEQRGASNLADFTEQIIKSEPNEEQTDDLKIRYKPNSHFQQDENYLYPVVKMPKNNSFLKLPRIGRSNQKGYKENSFYDDIKKQISDIELTNNVHMVIPNCKQPYEPDIVLFDKGLNLYIDIEIDEPYDGYFRYPTHSIKQGEVQKKDDTRDLFFTESGWIVIRFTEKQVHLQSYECINYIKNVLNSINNRHFITQPTCSITKQWNDNQCIKWQKINYRERYLGIDHFRKTKNLITIEINTEVEEGIEKQIQRSKKFDFGNNITIVAFDEETHKYIHGKDETGNAEYISVTTLIERFFPFDLKRYIEKKAIDENRDELDVSNEFITLRNEAAEKGTDLHNQIENYLKGNAFNSKSKEFQFFLNFYDKEIKKRNLHFYDAEKVIISDQHNVAGTIDCLFKKSDKDEYVMLDWKRSKKLIIDGRPKIFGFGYALSELSALDNSSYYKYCLQQNIYKEIVEKEYAIKISSMQLVILHENYPNYYVVKVPDMFEETNIILNSLKHKI